uniref:Uncharacterized protein n=1 Tax=Anguilla anguilla TaxID=7936 RepID=A0A0E9RBM3_ANGAN
MYYLTTPGTSLYISINKGRRHFYF